MHGESKMCLSWIIWKFIFPHLWLQHSWGKMVSLFLTTKGISHIMYMHDIYTVNGITIRTLRLDFTRNYNVLSFRHNVSQQYLMVCWLWRLGPYLNSTLWVRSSPGAFSNFFVGGSKVDPKLHPIHKGTCGDTIHSINTMGRKLKIKDSGTSQGEMWENSSYKELQNWSFNCTLNINH